MDVDKIIEDVERYIADFILYLVTFFRRPKNPDPPSPTAPENNVIVFSILSALLGSYVTRRYGQETILDGSQLFNTVISELLKWIAYGVVLYAVMSWRKSKIHMIEAVTAILKIFPVAYVVGAFTSYVAFSFVELLGPAALFKDVAATWTATLVELGFITLYIQKGFAPLPAAGEVEGGEAAIRAMRRQRRAGALAVLAIVYLVVLVKNLNWFLANQATLARDVVWVHGQMLPSLRILQKILP